jgi:hypothetical protein
MSGTVPLLLHGVHRDSSTFGPLLFQIVNWITITSARKEGKKGAGRRKRRITIVKKRKDRLTDKKKYEEKKERKKRC